MPSTASDIDSALRLVTSLSEFVHLRIGYEASGWAERALEIVDPEHPLFAAAVGFAARGAWNRGDQARARELASLAHGRLPGRGNGRVAYPATCSPTWACTRAIRPPRWRITKGRWRGPVGDDDPIRLVWTLFYVAICQAALRTPEAGLAAAEEAVQVADVTANPTARSMATLRAGPCPQEIRPGQVVGAIRRSGGVGRLGPEFLVAWHRVDGSGVDSRRAQRSSKSGK